MMGSTLERAYPGGLDRYVYFAGSMIHFEPLTSIPHAQALWQQLLPVAQHTFFQSAYWVETWLHSVSPMRLHLLTVTEQDALVAAGIFAANEHRRHGVLPVRTLGLQCTGNAAYDCVAAEYGRLLVREGYEDLAWRQTLDYLQTQRRDWDELLLEGVAPASVLPWTERQRPVRMLRVDRTYFADLAAVRAAPGGSCLALLRPRLRSRLRSSRRLIESRLGPLRLTVASTADEAQAYFAQLKLLHDRQWHDRDDDGAFKHPLFERFHRRLIDTAFASGAIQLARIDAGDTALAYAYNFDYHGRVYYYQSGVNYSLTEHNESPGLLMHTLLMDYNAARGRDTYDMLAGASQYKQSLTTGSEELWWVALQQSRGKLVAERLAKRCYRQFVPVRRATS